MYRSFQFWRKFFLSEDSGSREGCCKYCNNRKCKFHRTTFQGRQTLYRVWNESFLKIHRKTHTKYLDKLRGKTKHESFLPNQAKPFAEILNRDKKNINHKRQLACVAGVERGRGQREREKRRGIQRFSPSPFPHFFLRTPRRIATNSSKYGLGTRFI